MPGIHDLGGGAARAVGTVIARVGLGDQLPVACLVGALAFHVAHGLHRGDLTLSELQERAEAARSGFARAAAPEGGSRPAGRVS